MPESVFTTDDPEINAKWADDMRRYREWHEAVGVWAKQYPDHKAVQLQSEGHVWLSGLAGESPGPDWRCHPRYDHWIPRKNTRGGKALAAEVEALEVKGLGVLDGMPTHVWSQMPHLWSHGTKEIGGRLFVTWSHGTKEIGGRLFVTWACEAKYVEQEKGYDAAKWRRCPLSEFYAAEEAADAARGGR